MSSEHWLDRMSVRLTRRQAMKAGLAGALLSGLPLVRAPTADAADACFKGCQFTANSQFHTAFATCATGIGAGALISYLINPAYGYFNLAGAHVCKDGAILNQKASSFDCLQPNCNGFNPKQHGGPCADCNNNCCTCGASDNGYICCVFDCNDPTNSCCPGG